MQSVYPMAKQAAVSAGSALSWISSKPILPLKSIRALPPFQFTQFDGTVVYEIPRLTIKDGVDPKTITFETGYADDAIRNFRDL